MKDLDWKNLSFGYRPTDYNVRCYYRDGKWGEIEVCSDEYLKLHMAATCLHYGQEAFEGLKAYRCKDGKVRTFRVKDNAERLQSTCRGIMMPEVPTELFTEMVNKVVRLNQEWIPTYESGATLYIRPLLIGTSAQVGVHPAKEYCFLIFVTPVGPYFKGGFSSNPYVIVRDYDRSAPLGTGKYKVGGNYAASLFANNLAHEKGYACEFYLDAKEKKYIDECGAANFFGIKNNTYVTPKSTSILPSITNRSLMQVAEDLGLKVERRQIPEEELETFEEAGACGTAAVISPISYIDDLDTGKRYSFGDQPGPISKKLYDTLRGIQYGEIEDKHGWTNVVITIKIEFMEYNNQENTFVPQPKDYKVWSIVNLVISILFCCQCLSIASLVLSIIALMKSNDVNKYNMMGESSAILAQDASKTAKTLNIISSILLAVNFAIDIVYMLIWGIAGIAEAMQH